MIKLFQPININKNNKDINNNQIENDENNRGWFKIPLKKFLYQKIMNLLNIGKEKLCILKKNFLYR